jgi:hypothetical protein
MVHLKRSLLLLTAILAIQFLQTDELFAAHRKAKAKPKPKAKVALSAQSSSRKIRTPPSRRPPSRKS